MNHPNQTLSATLRASLLAVLVALAAPAQAALSVLINPGDHGEQSRQANYLQLRAAVADALREARLTDVSWHLSLDATADLASTRAQLHDVVLAPAHVISSALRNGYVPLIGNPRGVQAVLVTLKGSGIRDLASSRGRRLGLPLQDSVVTYLVRGELNAANSSLKSHFSQITHQRWQDALLVCLNLRQCDVVAVERAVFDRWVTDKHPVVAVMESRGAPGLSVALKQSLASTSAKTLLPLLTKALQAPAVARSGVDQAGTIASKDFDYVSTLGYFTPRQLPGAKVVDAAAVEALMKSGATYVDTRTEAEFKAGHVAGARLVPYVEKSPKDTDYDAKLDSFDLAKLPADKAAPLVFACNGAECWKSYKACKSALQAGYTQVHWFRGGIPEWRQQGRPVAGAAL